ncbi:MAG: response regulator, partial [Paracoccus sp. (in: a-proteobacteria)]
AELALDHISNVLSVIQGEQGVRGGQPDEDFRIVDEITSMVALVEPIASARATRISLTVDAPEDLTLKGPLRFVRALCQNLIDNSVNHGGGQIDLTLTCRSLNESDASDDGAPDDGSTGDWYVGIELRDEGGGLPYAQKKRLAEALGLMLESAAPHGTTLDKRPSAGLNVLAHALRQLGGRIEINDRGSDGNPMALGSEGRVIGTVFRASFTLPRAPDMTQAATVPEEGAETPLAGQTLLLVEDSPSTRDWLAHVLQSFGAEVFAAGSGPEALALLSRPDMAEKIGLVLTDVSLPRMNGIELARRLSHGDPTSAAGWRGVIVGLTAHSDDSIRNACRQAGMSFILQKPIPPIRLCAALVDALSGSRLDDDRNSTRADFGPALVDPAVVRDLFERLGAEPARGFIHRALNEAQSVVDELREDGIGEETGRRLHAATGAAGMTGLVVVESHLRDLEGAIDAGIPGLEPLLARIVAVINGSRQFTDTFE